jgi:short subunit dehydrogenase-like uncharacterized protein
MSKSKASTKNVDTKVAEAKNAPAMSKAAKTKTTMDKSAVGKAKAIVAGDKKPKAAKIEATKNTSEKKPSRLSALDAAATVLKKAGKPMRAQELITAMAEQKLWTSPGGKTPSATLYAAILRETATKGKDARFKKVERGLFEFKVSAK